MPSGRIGITDGVKEQESNLPGKTSTVK